MVLKFQHTLSTVRHSQAPFSKRPITSPARAIALPPQSPLQLKLGRFVDKLQRLVLNHQSVAVLVLGAFERVLDLYQDT